MNTMKLETLASGITEQSILKFLNRFEPLVTKIQSASKLQDLKAKQLATAKAMVEHGLVA